MEQYNLLVLGSRKGLKTALDRRKIPYTICKDYLSDPPKGQFTHVIASGEGSVVLANRVRQELGLTPINEEVVTLCSDKLEMKKKAKSSGVPVTPFLSGDCGLSSEAIYVELGSKVVVKDKDNSGGKGQQRFLSPEKIESNENQLIEGFIVGKEMSIESFIQNGTIKFTSTTEYMEIGVVNIVPSQLNDALLDEVLSINQKVIDAFGIRNGLTHLEVYLTEKGVLFGEIALRPPGGHIMTLIKEAHGIDPWDYYIDLHLGIELPITKSVGANAGAIVYHPGNGTVKTVDGLKELETKQTLKVSKIKGKIGDTISKRDGVGQEQAHFIFSGPDRDLLVKEVQETRATFTMVME